MNPMLVLTTLATLGIAGAADAQSLATPPVAARSANASTATSVVSVAPPPRLTALRTLHSPPAVAGGAAVCSLLNSTGEPIRIQRIEVRTANPEQWVGDPSSSCPGHLSGERLLPDRVCHAQATVVGPGLVTCQMQYESSNAGAVASFSFNHDFTDPTSSMGLPQFQRVILPLQHTP